MFSLKKTSGKNAIRSRRVFKPVTTIASLIARYAGPLCAKWQSIYFFSAGQCAWDLCILLLSPLVLSGRERSGRQEAGGGGRSEGRGTKHRLSFWQRTSLLRSAQSPVPTTHYCQHYHGRVRELSRDSLNIIQTHHEPTPKKNSILKKLNALWLSG